jgi:hypothetical protein
MNAWKADEQRERSLTSVDLSKYQDGSTFNKSVEEIQRTVNVGVDMAGRYSCKVPVGVNSAKLAFLTF